MQAEGSKVRAAVTTAPGEVEITTTDPPTRHAGEAIVRVQLSMLTAADAAWFAEPSAGLLPMVQGGAAAGILETGSRSMVSGSHVVVWPWVNCRRCAMCRVTSNEVCDSRGRLGIDRPGTLGERVVVPRANVVRVPSSVGPAEAVAAAEYTDAWRLIADAGPIGRRSRVLVAGTGRIADQVVAFAERMTATVVKAERLVTGLTFTDIVAIDAPVDDLLPLLIPTGTLVFRGQDSLATALDLGHIGEARLTIRGGGRGDARDHRRLLKWMGDVGFDPVVGEVIPLEEVGPGLRGLGSGAAPLIVTVR